jgi:hypothetical protein
MTPPDGSSKAEIVVEVSTHTLIIIIISCQVNVLREIGGINIMEIHFQKIGGEGIIYIMSHTLCKEELSKQSYLGSVLSLKP